MTDYLQVVLTGFSTGLGVIFAQEAWLWLKRQRLHRIPMDIAENLVNDVKDIGTKKRRY